MSGNCDDANVYCISNSNISALQLSYAMGQASTREWKVVWCWYNNKNILMHCNINEIK